jgi:hypothetical protein
MPSNASYVIDAAQTFQTVILMGCQKRTKFQSDEVDTDVNGTPKWSVDLAISTLAVGNMPPVSEVIKATCASATDPCEGLNPGTQVQLQGFRIGISAPEQRPGRDGGTKIFGGKPFFSCTGVTSAATPSWSKKSDNAA